jgi:hypothetical protein
MATSFLLKIPMTPPLSSPVYGELVEPLGEEILHPLLEERVRVRSFLSFLR